MFKKASESNSVEEVKFRITQRDLMDLKNSYDLMSTDSALKWYFEQQHPTKEMLGVFTVDPDPISEGIIVTVKAKERS